VTADELDRILAGEEALEPSSGFVSSVMETVRREVEEPPPLPFPWARFAAGLLACTAAAAAATLLAPRFEPALAAIVAPMAPLLALGPELGYAALALLVGLGTARLPRLLARG
jgi:hypothetical protein